MSRYQAGKYIILYYIIEIYTYISKAKWVKKNGDNTWD